MNPLRLVAVKVDVPDEPCEMLRLVGLVVMEKSGPLTMTEIPSVWNNDPLIPAMEAKYVPGDVDVGAETVMIEVPV